ncbi:MULTISPECIES: spermidine synthase [unclassified Arthrobacter]|uniref:spermidine synthase n=1 Tax=unclassified Arthrobacter TaxID=235627 RepID=UPI00210268DC|nr:MULTISPECIES: fused MFS/spermidine synthase [unclassified Arthrobacter]MCQ1946459.1 fused MFS/spermidine synthase [Arthrobacter sp. zg-Y1116]MCQ1986399.1 fused MFS/spermidine synthase [Arthrobacter sp. zg-Y844]
MGRKRPGKDPVDAVAGTGPVAGTYPIDTGTCELVPDSFSSDGWILMVNGVHSSHIDLADPRHLDFEYMRWIVALVESRWRPDASLRALHLGAAACSLARYLAAVYPGARQVAVELDGRLAELVRGWFDLPRAPLLRLRVGEARAVTETLHEDSRDLVIRDVFAGAKTPVPLTTAEFTAHVARVLAPGGVYVVNCGDTPDLRGARAEAATICAAFEYTAAIADPAMLKGRRYGNIILAGSDTPFAEDPSLPRTLLGGAVPAHLWDDAKVRSFAAGSRPLHDDPVREVPAEQPVPAPRR